MNIHQWIWYIKNIKAMNLLYGVFWTTVGIFSLVKKLMLLISINFIIKLLHYLFVCLFDRGSAQLLSCTRVSYKQIYCSPWAGDRDIDSEKKIKHYSIPLFIWNVTCKGFAHIVNSEFLLWHVKWQERENIVTKVTVHSTYYCSHLIYHLLQKCLMPGFARGSSW